MWNPKTVEALEQAVSAQSVTESAFHDFKSFPAASNSGNKELAKDIAAFSVEGGVMVLGVEEDKASGTFSLDPQELTGWKERLSQIGLNRVQPSVRVTCTQLEKKPGFGYLVIQVPASGRAPHMVDGRYYGRSDTTNYQLSDIEVRALIARTQDRRYSISEILTREIERDPTPDIARHARLFVVAQPISANTTLLLDAAPVRDLMRLIDTLLQHSAVAKSASYTPSFGHLNSFYRRANGIALSSFHMTSARTSTATTKNDMMSLMDLEVREDGGLRFLYGRASDTQMGQPNETLLVVDGIIGTTSRIIELARAVSEIANFSGSWQFGMALVNLKGTQTLESARNIPQRQSLYDEDTYTSVTEADQIRLSEVGSSVLEELSGRFFRFVEDGSLDVSKYDEFPVIEAPDR